MNIENENPNEISSATQNAKILAYLQDGETITSLEALHLFKCFRLASRMSDLKKKDIPFETVRIQLPSTGKYVVAYFIPEAFAKKHNLELSKGLATSARFYATQKISAK